MRFTAAIDAYMVDQRAEGRISSDGSEQTYRLRLKAHAEDVQNRDPRYTSREDVKRTLARFRNPNTQAHARSILVSFYTWLEEEGMRRDNPARQTRRPRTREPQVYRLTRDETLAMLRAPVGVRETRAIFLGFCAGARNAELRGLQGRHFERDDWIWVSRDIAKGGKERWVPVIEESVAFEISPFGVSVDGLTPVGMTARLPAGRWVASWSSGKEGVLLVFLRPSTTPEEGQDDG